MSSKHTFKVGDKVKLDPANVLNKKEYKTDYYFGKDRFNATYTVVEVYCRAIIRVSRAGYYLNGFNFSSERFIPVSDRAFGEFRVGDVVLVKDDSNNNLSNRLRLHLGKTLEVTHVDTEYVHFANPIGGGWDKGRFSLVTAVEDKVAAPASEPKHGVGQYILIVMKNGKPAPSTAPRIYTSWRQAKAVGMSLADDHKSETFVIFKKIAEVSASESDAPKAELKLVA
jgi:hypothetical protein